MNAVLLRELMGVCGVFACCNVFVVLALCLFGVCVVFVWCLCGACVVSAWCLRGISVTCPQELEQVIEDGSIECIASIQNYLFIGYKGGLISRKSYDACKFLICN